MGSFQAEAGRRRRPRAAAGRTAQRRRRRELDRVSSVAGSARQNNRSRVAPGIRRVPGEPGCRCSSRSRFGRSRRGRGMPRPAPLDAVSAHSSMPSCATCLWTPTAATIRQWAQLNARIVGAPPEEIEAACSRVEAALAHPLLDRARRAERKHREYPVMLRVDNGRLMEGIIDLAFVEDNAWIDRRLQDRRGYFRQPRPIPAPASVVRERSQSPDWLASTGVSAWGVDFRSSSV